MAQDHGTELWSEPLDTSGLIPHHLKRAATSNYPILEVLQRLLYRIQPGCSDLEKVLALIGLYQAVRPVYRHLKDLLAWMLTVEITIPETDPVAKDVLAWVGSQVISNSHTRNAMLVTGGVQDANDDFHRRLMMHQPPTQHELDDRVLCLPPIGTRLFWVGYRPFIFSRRGGQSPRNDSIMTGPIVDDNGRLRHALTITTLGWSLRPLQRFIGVCREFRRHNLTGTTTVYFAGAGSGPYGQGWQSVSKTIRKLDTIDMDQDLKLEIVRDAEYYYGDQCRQFFANCGIPYRRGYLFHGPPGTGKSSFSFALAGHLNCDIYHVNLSSGDINDGNLHRLFLGLPRKCIVVIEDIDSAGIGREQGSSTQPQLSEPVLHRLSGMPSHLGEASQHSNRTERRNRVTLSGLLNAIDGNASQEGRLLIMTSNKPDALDVALTRPGRIDKKIYFGNMTQIAGRSIFKRLIGCSALGYDTTITKAQIDQYADAFAAKIPPNTFSPAQVQNFLQSCRGDPVKALAEIDAWVHQHGGSSNHAGASSCASDAILVDNEVDNSLKKENC